MSQASEMSTASIRLTMEKQFPQPKSRVWQILSDTNRLNRAIGLDPVNKQKHKPKSVSRTLKSKALQLIPMEWEEYPFEWTHEQWYEVFRHYAKGPMSKFRSGIQLKAVEVAGEEHTMVTLYSTIIPASAVMHLPVKLIAQQSMHKTFRYIESSIVAAVAAGNQAVVMRANADAQVNAQVNASHDHKVNDSKLNHVLEQLDELGFSGAPVERLADLIRRSDDQDVADIRPYVLAKEWQLPRSEVLKLMLHGTRLGLFNLEWRLICPNCRVAESSSDKLAAITESYHCDYCGIQYEVMFDRYVELCFSVHPEVRRAVRSVYCVGAPAMAPHIHTQRLIRIGESIRMELPEQAIDWRLRVLRSNERLEVRLSEQSEGSKVNAEVEGNAGSVILAEHGWVQEGIHGTTGGWITITNKRDIDVMVVLEREGWDDVVATASQVTMFPEFRALFASDVLAPGQQAGVSSLTVLFTDLCGSTAYYESVGDASAYGYVRQMFEFLSEQVQQHGGVVVKTIGDAVMAVFDSPEAGFRAALNIQQDWHSLKGLDLRIGLHHGPAVTVGMNGRNDYFGRTVNMAARIQAIGGPREIVLEAGLLAQLGGQQRNETFTVTDPFVVDLKGMLEPVQLVRVLFVQHEAAEAETKEAEAEKVPT
ncbi:adenylate/guanylate cyclase domain-containing protein [Paenibacillus sp. CF384]|uniref:adenylate/guanylate cyclase domain-containing protein n=1 Tax=Paenibacillus sp. CF384 TaxID=1884382 RepID=UPI000897A658|nr:adenylate/guanylate cyclase domain-containing protein [Paenibacillus sp. CF384]SDW80046.1 Adenylate cyclase, class 3 [Paenibacillus sp. CF384]